MLEISRRILGEEHPDTLASMGDAGQHSNGSGRSKRCPGALRKGARNQQAYSGRRAPRHANVHGEPGQHSRAQGDLNGARELYEKVLEISRRILGEEHPDTLTSMNNLAALSGLRAI